jgi:hypothetical protein
VRTLQADFASVFSVGDLAVCLSLPEQDLGKSPCTRITNADTNESLPVPMFPLLQTAFNSLTFCFRTMLVLSRACLHIAQTLCSQRTPQTRETYVKTLEGNLDSFGFTRRVGGESPYCSGSETV